MGIEEARAHLKKWNRDSNIIEFDVSSATVELAARALNTEEARIAKTISLKGAEGAFLIVAAGDVKIDNQKFKHEFHFKAKMLGPEEVKELVGHDIGGVCPFGIKDGVKVFLDASLRRFETVFPAAGSGNSAIRMTCKELEEISGCTKWIDVCRVKE
jgi:prolyl-tRNA editing enzyme YbaK/EbsC (Cys-tRNA(Pro) deacylase)